MSGLEKSRIKAMISSPFIILQVSPVTYRIKLIDHLIKKNIKCVI